MGGFGPPFGRKAGAQKKEMRAIRAGGISQNHFGAASGCDMIIFFFCLLVFVEEGIRLSQHRSGDVCR
jgi:hypothetical protein